MVFFLKEMAFIKKYSLTLTLFCVTFHAWCPLKGHTCLSRPATHLLEIKVGKA